mmetsp:Transcript_4655/g.9033  ORF Transcript_4655/g.9033 Transcript_4655/m.9033 type:complete len:341 (+) Transcript_4655:634-1656(+)
MTFHRNRLFSTTRIFNGDSIYYFTTHRGILITRYTGDYFWHSIRHSIHILSTISVRKLTALNALQHISYVVFNLLAPIAVFISTSVLLIQLLLLELGPRCSQTEGPKERRRRAKAVSDRIYLMDQIFHANNTSLISQCLLNNRIVRKGDTLPINLAMTSLSNQVGNEGLAGNAICHKRFHEVQHLPRRFVVAKEHALVDTAETHVAQCLAHFAGHAGTVADTHGENDIGPDRIGSDLHHLGFLLKSSGNGPVFGIIGNGGNFLRLDNLMVGCALLHALLHYPVVPYFVIPTRPTPGDELLGLDYLDHLGLGGEYLAVAARIGNGLGSPMGLHFVHVVTLL